MKISILLINLLLIMKKTLAEENGLGNLINSKIGINPSNNECQVVNKMLGKDESFECCNLLNVVECENKHITKLHIEDRNITGEIPDEIGNLIYLRELWLDHNKFSGKIPASIGNIVYLRDLSLGANKLYGKIPAELSKLKDLEKLNLYENQLKGNIPHEFGDLSNLWHLDLHNNSLNGEIPFELGKLSKLKVLNLDYNELNITSIPQQIQNLPNLTEFYYTNQLEHKEEKEEKKEKEKEKNSYEESTTLINVSKILMLPILVIGIIISPLVFCLALTDWIIEAKEGNEEIDKYPEVLNNNKNSDRKLPENDSIVIENNQIAVTVEPPKAIIRPHKPQPCLTTLQLKQQIEQQEKQLQQQMEKQQLQLQQIQQMKNQLKQY